MDNPADTASRDGSARIGELRVYPIKSLDGCTVETATFGSDGGFVRDRQLALVGPDGEYVNGKRTAAIHRIRATYDLAAGTVRLAVSDGVGGSTDEAQTPTDDPSVSTDGPRTPTDDPPEPATVSLTDGDRLADWFSDYFGMRVRVRDERPGYPDDTTASGPTVVSRATLATVADWFGIAVGSVTRRFRANVVFTGVEPFWEDRLYGDRTEQIALSVGDTRIRGEGPCRRCVVPTRDPVTGTETPNFTERFVDRRLATLPEWSDGERFEGGFRLAVNTVVPPETAGEQVAVGDPVTRLGSVRVADGVAPDE